MKMKADFLVDHSRMFTGCLTSIYLATQTPKLNTFLGFVLVGEIMHFSNTVR
jgi:hypothetical protein